MRLLSDGRDDGPRARGNTDASRHNTTTRRKLSRHDDERHRDLNMSVSFSRFATTGYEHSHEHRPRPRRRARAARRKRWADVARLLS